MTDGFRGRDQGVVVELNLHARLFGVRLLRLEGHVVLTPTPSAPTAASGPSPSRRLPADPPTASLSQARRLVQESERSLTATSRAETELPSA